MLAYRGIARCGLSMDLGGGFHLILGLDLGLGDIVSSR